MSEARASQGGTALSLVVLSAACLVGLLLLAYAADQLVIGSSALASRLGVPPVVIGVLVMGFGTSAPELLVSGLAAADGAMDIGIGNVLGSNIANVTLVLGAGALVAPIAVQTQVIRREAPLALAACAVFAVVVQGGLTRLDGALLLVALVTALLLLLRWATRQDVGATHFDEHVAEILVEHRGETARSSLRLSLQAAGGLLGTLAGAQILVWGARGLAREANLSEGFVGLTIVAIGTSLPELMTALQAARRGESDLLVGNLLGSNVFNALAVGGLVGMVGRAGPVDPALTGIGVWLMLATSVLAMLFMGRRFAVARWEGLVLLAAFAISLPLVATR